MKEKPGNRTALQMTPRTILGLAAMMIGVLLTLDNLHVVELGILLGYWPLGLILLGFRQAGRGGMKGIVLILLGTAFLAHKLLDVSFVQLGPIILLLLGVGLVWNSIAPSRGRLRREATRASSEGGEINLFGCVGAERRQVTSQEFRGGTLTAFLGGCDLDLTKASLKGGEAVLEIFAMWGAVNLRVPEGWDVSLRVVPIMGGAEDDRYQHRPPLELDAVAGQGRSHLVVQGLVLMGGVDVRL
jgi:predicted membrane protein